jgi:hypothetical protein
MPAFECCVDRTLRQPRFFRTLRKFADRDLELTRISRTFGQAAEAAIDRIKAQHQAVVPLNLDPLLGIKVQLDRTCDGLRPCCKKAGGCIGVSRDGAGPHAFGLRCERCDRHVGWLGRRAVEALRRLWDAGRLSALPVLKDAAWRP